MNTEIGNLSFMQRFRNSFPFRFIGSCGTGMNPTAVYRAHIWCQFRLVSFLHTPHEPVSNLCHSSLGFWSWIQSWIRNVVIRCRWWKLFRYVHSNAGVAFDTNSTALDLSCLCSSVQYHRSIQFSSDWMDYIDSPGSGNIPSLDIRCRNRKLFRKVGPVCLVGFHTDCTRHGSTILCSTF